jgi:hypothetical protein
MLRDIQVGLETVAAFPALGGRPVVADECDRAVGTIYGVYDNPNFVVTNTEYYRSRAGATATRPCACPDVTPSMTRLDTS